VRLGTILSLKTPNLAVNVTDRYKATGLSVWAGPNLKKIYWQVLKSRLELPTETA